MNDYLTYNVAKQRYADLINEIDRSRANAGRNDREPRATVRTRAQRWFAAAAQLLTHQTRVPSTD